MSFLLRYILVIALLSALSATAGAQTESNLWSNVKAQPRKAQERIHRQGSRIKRWKDHLEQWGLDSVYNHGLGIGAQLNSNGWTGLVTYQRRIDRAKSHFFQLAFSEVKHEKQVKQQRSNTAFPELGTGTPFVFGKVSNLYLVQLGHGREFLVLPGVLEGNLSVSVRAQAGFSLAVTKPYYLQLIYLDPDQHPYIREEKYSEANSDRFLNTGYIFGGTKWKKGLNELSFAPGGYADIAVVIEPGKGRMFIKTVSLGGQFSIHSKSPELMARQKAYPWQACLYAGLSLGKRW